MVAIEGPAKGAIAADADRWRSAAGRMLRPVQIVPVEPGHLPALLRICLLTGDSGGNAEALYRDGTLLGQYYAAPYAALEPESCFVLLDDAGAPCGYVVGTRDSARFAGRMDREWLPPLRARLPPPTDDDTSADARILRLIHAPFPVPACAGTHPAHLHIDLLPQAQGRGAGRRLLNHFLDHLRRHGVRGVHLGVGARNSRAMRFYERLGFDCLETPAWGRWYGIPLAA